MSIPARTPQEAVSGFRDRMGKVASCICKDNLLHAVDDSDEHALYYPGETGFRRVRGEIDLHLSILHTFRPVSHEDGGWRVSTLEYSYDIRRLPEAREATLDEESLPKVVLQYHWQPRAPVSDTLLGWITYPHLHIDADVPPMSRKIHIPAGRVSLESVVRLLIEQFKIRPLHANWAHILNESEESFISSWPQPTRPPIALTLPDSGNRDLKSRAKAKRKLDKKIQ